VRLEPDSVIVQFAVKALNMRLKKRTLDADGQVADTGVQQSLI
jgi:hypothetical protein